MFDIGKTSNENAVAGSQSLTSSYVATTKVFLGFFSVSEQ